MRYSLEKRQFTGFSMLEVIALNFYLMVITELWVPVTK